MKKRLFFLTAALLMAVVSFAQPRATVEKLWSRTVADIGSTKADSRQAAGFDGTIYVLNKNNHSLVGVTETQKDSIIKTTDGITALDGTAFAIDDAGNFVVEGTFPSAPSHLYIRKADGSESANLSISGYSYRTDYINATGDIFSAEGGYVFLYGNSTTTPASSSYILICKIVNGDIANTTEVNNAGATFGNYVIDGNETTQIVHHRSSETGWVRIENGVATTIADMEGFKKSTLGGDIITLGGNEYYIYPSGNTNYSSEFSVRDMTTGVLVADKTNENTTVFYANTATTKDNNYNFCSLIATPIDEYSAYIHVYTAADGLALYKLTAPRLYEIGDNNGWAKNPGTEMEVIAPNVYEGVFTFPNATSFFTFATVASDDWNGDQGTSINENRWGAPSENCAIADGETKALVWQGTNSFAIAAGKYRLTVDLSDSSNPQVTATAIPDIPTVSIAGLDGWDVSTNVLEDANDHLTASKSIHLTPNIYEFKVVLNGTAWYTDHNAPATSASTDPTEMNRANSTGWVFDKGDGYKNTGLRVDLEGDYEFVYTYATKALSISGFPTSFTRTVTAEGADKYQTLCVPFDATVSGATVYEFDGATETGVTLNAVASDALEAGKSYLILPESAGSIVVSAIPAGDVAGAPEELHGLAGFYGILGAEYNYVYAENDFATYVLQNDNKFHKIIGGASATITSTHAYLHVPDGTAAPELRIIMGATNIENVEGMEQAVKFIENGQMFIKKNGVVYDMMGHAVR